MQLTTSAFRSFGILSLYVLLIIAGLYCYSLPFSFWPLHTFDLLFLNVQVFVIYFLFMFVCEIAYTLKLPLALRPKPISLTLKFLRSSWKPLFACLWFSLMFTVACIGQGNLKANIPLINKNIWDPWFLKYDLLFWGPWWKHQSHLLFHHPALVYFWNFFFELIYSLFGNYLTAVFFLLVWNKKYVPAMMQVNCLCYGLLVCVVFAILMPSIGPFKEAFEWFWFLKNSETQKYQTLLALMKQNIQQNPGSYQIVIINGLSAMPSFHVFSWFISTFFLRSLKGVFFRVGMALSLLNWVSTCVLGWHYFVDGLASVIFALCLYLLCAKIGIRYVRS